MMNLFAGRNRNDATVKVTHLPSGIVGTCEAYRQQHKNRDAALAQMQARIAAGQSHPLPLRAVYDLPDHVEAPNELDDFRHDIR